MTRTNLVFRRASHSDHPSSDLRSLPTPCKCSVKVTPTKDGLYKPPTNFIYPGACVRCGASDPHMHSANFQCAGCFEWIETTIDESGGSRQQYVEDCQVCCKPNVLTIRWDAAEREFTVSAELES